MNARSQPRVAWERVMAGSTFSDRSVAKGMRGPAAPYATGLTGRMLLFIFAAAIVAFGIAFAVGAETKPAGHATLAPATRVAESRLRIIAVAPAPATPGLKTPPERRAAPHRSTAASRSTPHRTSPAVVAVGQPAPFTPVVRPVPAARTVTPSSTRTTTPVASVPAGGSSGSGSRSGSTGKGTGTSSGGGAARGTGTSTGGDSTSGGGTGTASGGG